MSWHDFTNPVGWKRSHDVPLRFYAGLPLHNRLLPGNADLRPASATTARRARHELHHNRLAKHSGVLQPLTEHLYRGGKLRIVREA